jgi:hypothetical protein
MSAKFLEGFGGKLAEQWIANLLTPAFIFWSGGLLCYIDRHGWQPIAQLFPDAKLEALQVGVLALALVVILVSALVMQRFDNEFLRGLEGYWYPWFRRLGRPLLQRMTQCQIAQRNKLWKNWRQLSPNYESLSAEQRAEYGRIDRRLRQFPGPEHDFLPTRLGNILRAAERHPYYRYGLDTIICWPRIWLLLPDGAKKELIDARAELNNGVRLLAWSCLFLIWTIWSLWAIPIALLSISFAYSWILDSAVVYGDLIESVFDLYRTLLYKSLRFPLPENAAEEKTTGLELTQYLFRGYLSDQTKFLPPQQ